MTRQHVLQAIAEYDDRGAEDFLAVYGFERSTGFWLMHEGRTYDSKALLGVAHRFATGRLATPEEFHDGAQGAARILRKCGFDIPGLVEPAPPARNARTPRTTSTRATVVKTPAAREFVAVICPTCFTALPATGVCDNCS